MAIRNERKPVAERAEVGKLTLAELVREFAEQKAWFAVFERVERTCDGDVRVARLLAVTNELRRRGALD